MSATSGGKRDFPGRRELAVIAVLPAAIFPTGNFGKSSSEARSDDLKALMGTPGMFVQNPSTEISRPLNFQSY